MIFNLRRTTHLIVGIALLRASSRLSEEGKKIHMTDEVKLFVFLEIIDLHAVCIFELNSRLEICFFVLDFLGRFSVGSNG